MPQVEVTQSTFDRLQRQAALHSITVDEIINRCVSDLETAYVPLPHPWPIKVQEIYIDPDNLPSMKHTNILDATIDGRRIRKPLWNSIMSQMIINALKNFVDFNELQSICPIGMTYGHKSDQGYVYIPEVGLSLQGQTAQVACETIIALSRRMNTSLEIHFMWRAKEGAFYPGQRGRLLMHKK